MIELLGGFGDGVVAVACHGTVTRRDYETVLVPAVEAALGRHNRVRVYYEMAEDFAGFEAGAMWEDTKVGLGHLSRWERIAVVSDAEWIRRSVAALGFLMPAAVRVFARAERDQARAWVAG